MLHTIWRRDLLRIRVANSASVFLNACAPIHGQVPIHGQIHRKCVLSATCGFIHTGNTN
jgi:hypothetical protein